jgi:hypothetical protein
VEYGADHRLGMGISIDFEKCWIEPEKLPTDICAIQKLASVIS